MPPLRFKAVCTETGREFGVDNLMPETMYFKHGNLVQRYWLEYLGDADTEPKIYLCQFTGFTDANGQEVFFGDVLQDLDGGLAVVAWDQKAAKFGLQYLTPDWLACDYASMYLEDRKVIGNRWMPAP